jgi:threonine synthase
VVTEADYPRVMDWRLVEQFADGIPCFPENDPKEPEWSATPTIPVDLTSAGYGVIYVKDESDTKSNPTGTIKDRAAWELTTLYRDFARALYLKKKAGLLNGNIGSIPVPRLSYITAGNVGRAISRMFGRFGLPPMKLLVDKSILPRRLEILRKLHADIYMADLSRNVFEEDEQLARRAYTPEEIKILTNNRGGIDITSVVALEPQAIFYDWHVHEAFNEYPNEIYVPYGSGRLWENYLTWQERTIRNDGVGRRDPRLRVPVGSVVGMSVFGAEPADPNSSADKLTKSFNPFALFTDQDVTALRDLSFTGQETQATRVREERIRQAYDLLSQHVATEPSAAAGLALYLQRYDEGKINKRKKVLVVNTGRGI